MSKPSLSIGTIVTECCLLLIASIAFSIKAATWFLEDSNAMVQYRVTLFVVILAVCVSLVHLIYLVIRLGLFRLQSEGWKRRALYDRLTGVRNRSGLTLGWGEKMARGGPGLGIMLLILDADHFKRINDKLGHPAGDRALKAIAGTLAHSLRRDDLVGRMGGEEFAIVFNCSSEDQGRAIAERLRATIARLSVTEGGLTLPITVSIGGVFTAQPIGFQRLYDIADGNCYRSKRAGRNRVTTSTVPPVAYGHSAQHFRHGQPARAA
ncbi:MAG: GGDEF domain-containing protein [Pseudomonadota bacterium]|nr:GGDEF domain-containing protein [Pseudomonadota bacterium]